MSRLSKRDQMIELERRFCCCGIGEALLGAACLWGCQTANAAYKNAQAAKAAGQPTTGTDTELGPRPVTRPVERPATCPPRSNTPTGNSRTGRSRTRGPTDGSTARGPTDDSTDGSGTRGPTEDSRTGGSSMRPPTKPPTDDAGTGPSRPWPLTTNEGSLIAADSRAWLRPTHSKTGLSKGEPPSLESSGTLRPDSDAEDDSRVRGPTHSKALKVLGLSDH